MSAAKLTYHAAVPGLPSSFMKLLVPSCAGRQLTFTKDHIPYQYIIRHDQCCPRIQFSQREAGRPEPLVLIPVAEFGYPPNHSF
jgi:hypothetical protein